MQVNPSNQNIYPLALAALGIVYGDIGTSPLYAFEQVFSPGLHAVPISEANVLGVLSLFFWCLVMIVTVKYVIIVMRANHKGEGGILALVTKLLERSHGKPIFKGLLIFAGLVGAAFFYGDGVITPAISVLTAVEGMEVISPALKPYVIPVALAILVGLFLGQRFGTGKIGFLFGPTMVIWFVLISVLGFLNILENPQVLLAVNPIYAQEFVSNNGLLPFYALGVVVLCITGAEALYADMGHFGSKPIQLAWIGLVLPALALNYFGQGALLLQSPESLSQLFFLMAPASFHVAFVIFATLATIIASQAVISGAFSITKQAIDLGFLPKMRVVQTSAQHVGQIYIPTVNLMLLVMVVIAVLFFKSSNALAAAYGIAVTGTMLLTDILGMYVAIKIARWNVFLVMMLALFFGSIDLAFFTSNATKFMDGGWFPLGMSVVLVTVMAVVFLRSKKERL
jgi:KUP system potassium uptake protein